MPEEPSTKEKKTASHHDWYHLSAGAVAEKLSVDTERGLDDDAARGSRELHGDNSLTKKKQTGLLGRFIKQFKNPLVLILLVAGVITLLIGHGIDATVIFIALGINVIIGTIQEGRASNAFAALEKSQSKEATVFRSGEKRVIPAEEVVVGDVVELDAGMYVPADMRLVNEKNLKLNEAALTGEWMEVEKDTEKITDDQPVTGRKNMAYKGTLVSSGEGRGIVTAVGDATEVGKIAQELSTESDSETPIQKHMKTLAQFVAIISVVAVVVIFVLGVVRGEPLVEMLVFAIAVAVSVVPEGLPAAVTVVLALGMENILKRGGLVRNLRAAETLGSTTVIMTDKTGTLTQAKMQIAGLLSFDRIMQQDQGKAKDSETLSDLEQYLLEAAVTSSDAFVEEGEDGPVVQGRAIEKALVTRGLAEDLDKAAIDERRIDFLTFSSENRYAASLSQSKTGDEIDENELFVSGAPEFILEHSVKIRTEDGFEELDDKARKRIQEVQKNKGAEGKRLIAIAYKPNQGDKIDREKEGRATEEQVGDLVFLGLISFADPIREDVADSIAEAKAAGVHVLMVTGDNKETAQFIAREAGVATDDAEPLTGSELEGMSDDEVIHAVKTRTVFARVLPNQKLRLAKLLRDQREVVAMTGDGVNDAPALRAADIGVSVGSGTEVAKEASDLVLLDDSFSIIVAAIEEGRRIIDNLKKIIAHLLSTSFGGLFLIGGALIVGLPIPILTPQILWVNIVEGGLLTFVFAAEPPAPGIMKRDPSKARTRNLISRPMKWLIAASGTITGIAAFLIYVILTGQGVPIETVRTMMFVILTIDALLFVVALKDFYKPIFRINYANNTFLFISLGLSVVALFGALFIPALRDFLSLTPLSGSQWSLLAAVGVFDLAVVEVAKYVLFQRDANKDKSDK